MLTRIAEYVIKVVPESTASAITRGLAAITRRAPVSPVEQEAMAQASKVYFGETKKTVAWGWGDGPPVIFVHGWGGRAAQLAPLAVHVANLGFRSVAIDVTGHGDSPKRHTRWDYFFGDIAALSRSLQEDVYAYVGHSAGALSIMAARNLKGIHAQRYVCICAPSYPFPHRCHSKEIESEKRSAGTLQSVYRGAVRGHVGATAGWSVLRECGT